MCKLREGSVTKLSPFLTSAQYGRAEFWGRRKRTNFIRLTSAFSKFWKKVLIGAIENKHLTVLFSVLPNGFLMKIKDFCLPWALCCELNRKDSCSLQIWLVNKTGCYKGYLPYTKQGKYWNHWETLKRDLQSATTTTCLLHFGREKKKASATNYFLLLLHAGNKTRGSFIPENNDIATTSTHMSHTSLQEMQLMNRCSENHTLVQSRQNIFKSLLGEEVPG